MNKFLLIGLIFSIAPAHGAMTSCVGGNANGHACENVDLLSHVAIADMGGSADVNANGYPIEWVSDMWGWVDDQGTPENPADDREYAIVGRFCGTSFIDITDPENPVYLGNLPDHSEFLTGYNDCADIEPPQPKPNGLRFGKMHESDGSIWRDIKVYGHYAIIVAETNIRSSSESKAGMQIFDLHQLRGLVSIPVQFPRSSYTHYDGFGNSHNVFVNQLTGMVYAAGSSECQGGPHIVDIAVPTNPVQAGCFPDIGYTHDIQCVIYTGPDAAYAGREICIGSNGNQRGPNTLAILDVTDPANIDVIANPTYPNDAYSHQAWFSEDHRYVYHNDELDEGAGSVQSPNPVPKTRLMVWDVTDLDNPVLVTQFQGRTGATDHNNYVQGDYLYQSNYTAGLNILNISDPINPSEAGFFDNFIPYNTPDRNDPTPDGNESAYLGTWSNYPWYPSGTVAISDIRGGLYLVKPEFGVPDRIVVANVNASVRAIADTFEAAGDTVRFEVIVESHGPDRTNGLDSLVRLGNATVGDYEVPAGLSCTTPSSAVLLCKGLELATGESYVVEVAAVTGSAASVTATVFSTAWNVDITKTDNTDQATAMKENADDGGGESEGNDEGGNNDDNGNNNQEDGGNNEGENEEDGNNNEDSDSNVGNDDGGGSIGLLLLAGLLGLGLLRRR